MSDLNQLELEAQQIDADMAGAEFKPQESTAAESLNANFKPIIMKALSFPVALISERISFTSLYFNEAALNDIAESLIKVADFEQVDLAKLMGDPNSRMGAWIGLAIAVGMPSFMFYLAFMEARKTKPQAEKEVKAASEPQSQPTSFNA